jgi:hypothetical protein
MRTRRLTGLIAAATMAAVSGLAQGAGPLGTNFTYQGRLTSAGVGQSSSYDIRFQMYDAVTGGTLLGTVTKLATPLTLGVFTVDLDFGVQFTGDKRWLEIAVRPAGVGLYTTLTPRQELAPAPNSQCLRPLATVSEDEAAASVATFTNTDSAASSTGVTGQGYYGVYGLSAVGNDFSCGLYGLCTVASGTGGYGTANTGGFAYGLWGQSASGYGVVGNGLLFGGDFTASDPTGVGVLGMHTAVTGTAAGVEGDSASTDGSANAVYGHITSTSPGGFSAAVRGQNDGTGGNGIGVYGSQAGNGWGVFGTASTGYGVYGTGGTGVVGGGNTGVYGSSGLAGGNGIGVHGVGSSGNVGVRGDSSLGGGQSFGVYGYSTAAVGNGIRGEIAATSGSQGYGVWGADTTGVAGNYAGYFNGNVFVAGTLGKSGGSFKIDHPLDPANKYLSHSFVESPDMMNIYNGNATLDGTGAAVVTMPDWFEVLNTEFRYQLTAMGAPSPNLYIASEMHNRQFTIAGGTPGGRVSWQITGIRQDPWANANRIPVEEVKRPEERGTFIFPELYGMPQSTALSALKGAPAAPAPQRVNPAQDPAHTPVIHAAPAPAIKERP